MDVWSDGDIVFEAPKFQIVRRTASQAPAQSLYYVNHPGAVAILPILDDERIVLVRNRRWAINRELLEIPAGTRRPGEHPQAAAIRELSEETGYSARIWQEVLEFYVSPGITNERMTLFFARDLIPGSPHLEPDEDLRVEIATVEQCKTALREGLICDAKSIIALLVFFSQAQFIG
ncbi:ADP-ribose pyrophosphatase [Thermogutta terrifontis]|uniref:GDP-mannose pyrophosphatase n=1 Tax=Thermogutta terrifontis TaxID=1331910 RepID=A0A286RFJ0_9BACT|nr:NUDIX hydrolase [Thermogutta terrifontis]ASV74729.1 ADP-ribose pyrophosphatase [Thermogutta terrifontis]